MLSSVSLVSLFLLSGAPAAQQDGLRQRAASTPHERPSPLVPSTILHERVVRFDFDRDRASALAGLEKVRLPGVLVPTRQGGFEPVDLELERLRVVAPEAAYYVNGQRAGGAAEILSTSSMWTGKVAGEESSHVYLALMRTGARGWIERGDDRFYLLSVPEDGSWQRSSSFLVHKDDPMLASSAPPFTCEALAVDDRPRAPKRRLDRGPGRGMGAGPATGPAGPPPTYEIEIAVESDYQYWQLFSDTTAATDYAVSLMGAVSSQYLEQTNSYITLPYLGIYDNPADPWTEQDSGGDCLDVLFEFRDAWNTTGGGAPVSAALYHMISGADLGCGVAYLDVLCNPDFGFAVSGNLHGMTSFPVPTQDSLNWDFIVVAHELGHNYVTPHTHNYCPPLDECPPAQYFGACQTQQVCQVGTIMSYCHLCPGGITNSATEFHPVVAGEIATAVEAAACAIEHSGLTTAGPTEIP